ncbi:MAG: HEAT repeat domain-containing protein [Thermoanaerobacteraceae bacterium]
MSINWKELLLENKDNFTNISKETIDESMNFLGAKRKIEKNKVFKSKIFKYYISESYANILGEKIKKINYVDKNILYNLEMDIVEFSREILEEGQNPLEIIIYGTKGLNLNDEEVYKSIIRILKSISNNNANARKALISIIEDWEWENQVKIAIEVIKSIKEYEAFDALIKLLNNDIYKENAAIALIELEKEDAIDPILEMVNQLNGFNPKEKDTAFKIMIKLAQLGEKATKKIIQCYLDNENKSLNIVYSNVISRLKNTAVETMANLLYDNMYSQKAAITLGKMRTETAMIYLKKALYDPAILNKVNIIIGLGYTKNTNAIKLLIDILKDDLNSFEIKSCAITSLANIQAVEIKPFIEKFIDNKNLSVPAYSALVQLGEIKYLSNLFLYIVKPGFSNLEVEISIKEIKRLKGLKIPEINKQITDGLIYIIKNDEGYAFINTLKIIDTNIEDEFIQVLIEKINKTQKEEIQYYIYKILGKYAGLAKKIVDEQIFIDAVESKSTRIKYLAQRIIENNYKDKDKLISI